MLRSPLHVAAADYDEKVTSTWEVVSLIFPGALFAVPCQLLEAFEYVGQLVPRRIAIYHNDEVGHARLHRARRSPRHRPVHALYLRAKRDGTGHTRFHQDDSIERTNCFNNEKELYLNYSICSWCQVLQLTP